MTYSKERCPAHIHLRKALWISCILDQLMDLNERRQEHERYHASVILLLSFDNRMTRPADDRHGAYVSS